MNFLILFDQKHSFGLDFIADRQPIQINARCDLISALVGTIPDNGIHAGIDRTVDEGVNPTAEDIVDFQPDIRFLRQEVFNFRRRIKRIGVIAVQLDFSRQKMLEFRIIRYIAADCTNNILADLIRYGLFGNREIELEDVTFYKH